ncbi:MAG: hypothetical protein QME85_01140 [Candidatus Saccharicenans sp.]|nr:hypothetical protein [Candidatus Saccharicenans sp.]MDI6849395.1 hypothetical protein [Candidatus Saccharicenans sp.]
MKAFFPEGSWLWRLPAKAELLVKRKDELEAKARHCRQLLADL